MFQKLYVRIWLAVVLTVAVLTMLVGWIWRLAAEPPLRDVVVRNEAGQIIGRGRPRFMPEDASNDTDRPRHEPRRLGRSFNGLGNPPLEPASVPAPVEPAQNAASAAMIARVPIAHLHGGEVTEGVIDEAIRHSVSKMSHLHFVAAEEYRRRVIQLGEHLVTFDTDFKKLLVRTQVTVLIAD